MGPMGLPDWRGRRVFVPGFFGQRSSAQALQGGKTLKLQDWRDSLAATRTIEQSILTMLHRNDLFRGVALEIVLDLPERLLSNFDYIGWYLAGNIISNPYTFFEIPLLRR